jgi:hypothetical protein
MKPNSLTHIDHQRRTELTELADQIRTTQHALNMLRLQRDSRLRDWHEDGTSVELLATAAGLTRQGVYDAIERVRRLPAEGR